MEKIRYYFAAVYQDIKSRRPDGTPYFNTSLMVTALLLLSLLNVLMATKIWGHRNYISDSKNTFFLWFIGLAIFVTYIVRQIIPLEDIQDIEIDKKDVKIIGNSFLAIFVLSTLVMMVLLVLNGRNPIHYQ